MASTKWVVVLSYEEPYAPGLRSRRVLGFHRSKQDAIEHMSYLTPEIDGDMFYVMTESAYYKGEAQ